jgi:hypothetical protein
MALANVKSSARPNHDAGLSTADKPTDVNYGDTYFETDTKVWFIFTANGWVEESVPVTIAAGDVNIGNVDVLSLPTLPAGDNNIGNVDVVTLPALPAGTNKIGEVDIASALPAGTNNIGDVDVLTLPTLPAGDNNIGNVDIVTLPSLPAGTNNIGDVDVASIAAGENHLGEVAANPAFPVTVTPAIAAAAFAAGDIVGGKLTLANAVRVAGGKGAWTSLSLLDKAKQNAALQIILFKADLAGAYDDNDAEAISAADLLNFLHVVEIEAGDYVDLANGSLISLGFDLPVAAASGTSLYALVVAVDAPTYTENALQLTFGFERN